MLPTQVDAEGVDQPIANDRRWFSPPLYGLPTFKDIFTQRQLVTLFTLSDLVRTMRVEVRNDAMAAGLTDVQADDYTRAVGTFFGPRIGSLQ